MAKIFLARQPIYDRYLKVFGYELLFRNKVTDRAEITNGNEATSEVLVSTVMDIGLENVVGTRLAFINLTRSFLTDALPMPHIQGQVVLEILEDEVPDEELASAIQNLVRSGYYIALDDFTYTPEHRRLLEFSHFIKLDVQVLGREALAKHVTLLRGFNVKLLAEKVESQEEFEYCQKLGFDYFQGFFFSKPQMIVGRRTEGDRLIVLRFLAKLQNPAVTIDELEYLISQDASLVYHLLRYMNSVFYYLCTKVESIKHALTLLGTNEVRKWASLMLMLRLSDDKPKELLITGMIRAKMAELIGEADSNITPDEYFTVGLFSILDALMNMPLEEVLQTLPLSEEINTALLSHSGTAGNVLHHIIVYEHADWDNLADINSESYQEAYLKAIEWVERLRSDLV